jgi:hypothetical protein
VKTTCFGDRDLKVKASAFQVRSTAVKWKEFRTEVTYCKIMRSENVVSEDGNKTRQWVRRRHCCDIIISTMP